MNTPRSLLSIGKRRTRANRKLLSAFLYLGFIALLLFFYVRISSDGDSKEFAMKIEKNKVDTGGQCY